MYGPTARGVQMNGKAGTNIIWDRGVQPSLETEIPDILVKGSIADGEEIEVFYQHVSANNKQNVVMVDSETAVYTLLRTLDMNEVKRWILDFDHDQ
jgi:hypothetical protein